MAKKQPSLFQFFNKTSTPLRKEAIEPKTIRIKGFDVSELAIVWAKVEGHPWWPGIICCPPNGTSFIRKKSIHVQFFEDPPTRGWVKEIFIKPFGEPMKVGVPTYKDSAWRAAKTHAEEAAKHNEEHRRSLLVEHDESDSEMSCDDAESEGNSSKENTNSENVTDNGVSSSTENKKRSISSNRSDEPPKKRSRIALDIDSEESGDEYKPGKEEDSSDESVSTGVDESVVSENSVTESEPSPSPAKKSKAVSRKTPSSSHKEKNSETPYTPSLPPFSPYSPSAPTFTPSAKNANSSFSASPLLKSKLMLFAAKDSSVPDAAEGDSVSMASLKLPFLRRELIKDAEGRRPSDPDYDPRTLRVPEDFLNQQTPAHRQWWQFKSKHFDTILFFKMGKFYELFYMDAEVGVQELGLLLMKGAFPHVGFPEVSYCRYSASLIEKGYKVARIEQTETPEMMEQRCKSMSRATKFDKVVRRELCQLSSAGTRVCGVQDADLTSASSAYLLAVCARSAGATETLEYGVAFIDTSIGEFHLGQFVDDRHSSRLRTLLAHHPPVQILMEKNRVPTVTQSILANCGVPSSLLEQLAPDTEFWGAEKLLRFFEEEGSFQDTDGVISWPHTLKTLLDQDCLSPIEGQSNLSLRALGAIVWYLQRSVLHSQLLSRKLFTLYISSDICKADKKMDPTDESEATVTFKQRTMVIDGGSAVNLELFVTSNGCATGSLLSVLDNTSTHMGKRLLWQWVSAPLLSSTAIRARQMAVEDLRQHRAIVDDVTALLVKLPDIERLLPRIHSQGLKLNSSDPNSRAVYFEEQLYGKKRVQNFLSAIEAFKIITKLPAAFADASLKSDLLRSLVGTTNTGGLLPLMMDDLTFFEGAFDHECAKKEGKIIPCEGVDEQYDSAVRTVRDTKEELDDYLREQCQHFAAKVSYFGSDRKRYQLEVPESAVKRATAEYELISQRKGFKRFATKRSKELLAQMISAEEAREAALKDIARRIFAQFDERHCQWGAALHCVTTLDALLSLAKYSNTLDTVRPEIVDLPIRSEPFLEIRDGVHPSLGVCGGLSQDDVIPNDVVIGEGGGEGAHASLVLVTGPNMGGKSTLMRQTALLVIMAQIGSFVPCASMRLSPVDRIFTRVGASDRMLAGESTFLVELRETSAVLQHASRHALVLIDELGRGTATHDGTAVAWAVAGELATRGCRTLFSTHYHNLVQHFTNTPGVSLGHMACMVEGGDNEEDSNGVATEETVTFLYKFIPGVCPKSYGFNAAKLAEIPASVVQKARVAARALEAKTDATAAFRKLFGQKVTEDLTNKREIVKALMPIVKVL